MKEEYSISSVEKALNMLRVFTPENHALSVAEINRQLGLSYATSYRILSTLEANGFLYKNPTTNKYSLGLSVALLYENYVNPFPVREAARSFMADVMRQTSETAILYAVKSVKNNSRVCIERVESNQRLRTVIKIGDEFVLTQGAGGLPLAAFLSPEEQRYLLKLDPTLTQERIDEIRTQGYVINYGGRVAGITGISVPVFDRKGKILASLGVTGASVRFNPADNLEIIRILKENAQKIMDAL